MMLGDDHDDQDHDDQENVDYEDDNDGGNNLTLMETGMRLMEYDASDVEDASTVDDDDEEDKDDDDDDDGILRLLSYQAGRRLKARR